MDIYIDRWDIKAYPIISLTGITIHEIAAKKGIYCQYRKFAIHQYCIFNSYPFQRTKKQESGYTCQRFLFLGLHVTWSKNFLFYLSYKMRIRSVLYLKGAFCFKGNVINFLHCKGKKICHGISHLDRKILVIVYNLYLNANLSIGWSKNYTQNLAVETTLEYFADVIKALCSKI